MTAFLLNGKQITCEKNLSLLRFLRDDMHLTAAKDGCSEGACGTCTILMDGRPIRACIMTTKQADGKNLITVEGLSDFEKEAYVYAFGKTGAVQCGFCTPGMVMAAKALLDTNKNPSEDDVKKAIRGNICRCTGYKKILEAVLLAASIFRGDEKIDENLENMAHASAVRSIYPRAKVLKIDFSEAKKYRLDKDLSSEYLQDGDLLIPNKGNTSKVVLYKNSDKNCIASANLLVIRPDNKQISSEYLLTYLRSAVGQKLIKGLLRGTAMPFINHEDLKGIAVIVPALTKQKELIKNYTSKMEKYKKQLEQIKNDIMQLEQDVNDIICGTKQDF